MKRTLDRLFSHEEINGERCPTYLHRWTLLKLGRFGSVYLHKFVGDDWSLDLHDHPKRFWSIGLKGQYTELTPVYFADVDAYGLQRRPWIAPWIRTFAATHRHRLVGPTPEHPCWTLVIVGRIVRNWGFWSRGEWIPWKRYVNSETATERKACP